MVKGNGEGSHFVLVHGPCNGAWCWYKLSALLKSAGHRVTAVDLAASGINLTKMEDLMSISNYFQPLMDMMASLLNDDRVVLVAHCMGGVAASVAMENFSHKIRVAVFVTAFMPGPDLTVGHIDEINGSLLGPNYSSDIQFYFKNGFSSSPSSFFSVPKFKAINMYQNSPLEDLELSLSMVRTYPSITGANSIENVSVSEEKYGSIPRVFIISGQEKALIVPLQKFMIEKNPPNEVTEIPDSDHMVMFSKPKELCSYLLYIAAKY